jgi:ABC-type transporter Mla subunit MlaD
MSDQRPAESGRPTLRVGAAALVVIGFVVVVSVAMARLPGGAATPKATTTSTTTTVLHGNAAIEVEIELPPTTTTTTAKSGATTTTTTAGAHGAVSGSQVDHALTAAGYDVVGEVANLSPPAATTVEFTPGHETDADQVGELLGLPTSAVVAYSGAAAGITAGTDVVVVVGKAA